MGFFDKFLNAIKLNDDDFDDEDFLDDEDDAYDDEDEYEEKSKVRGRFFGRFRQDDDDYDDEDEDDEDLEDLRRRSSRSKTKAAERSSSSTATRTARASSERSSKARTSASSVKDRTPSERPARTSAKAVSSYSSSKESAARSSAARNRKVTPIRKRSAQPATGMEVSVIRPSSMEDTREIADTLMDSCTVILNLEGLDFDIAQRVIDFACGVCYSLRGNLQKVSGYIFILTPPDVDISGDYQSILDGVFDLPSLKLSY